MVQACPSLKQKSQTSSCDSLVGLNVTGLPVEEDFDYVWMEESEEEEVLEAGHPKSWHANCCYCSIAAEDDPTVEIMEEAREQSIQFIKSLHALREEQDVHDDAASSQADADALLAEVEDILYAKKPSSDQDLLDVWLQVDALKLEHRAAAATALAAWSCSEPKARQVRDALLSSAEAWHARDENKMAMWQDEGVRKAAIASFMTLE
eukprot:Skav229447  [mRNA]  locus=scaffold397:231294:234832:+ [translate_table: standard]